MTNNISQSDINHVMQSCSCSRRDAISLLKYSEFDPGKAVQRHEMKVKFGWGPVLNSYGASESRSPAGRPMTSGPNRFPEHLSDNEGYEVISPQSDQELFPKQDNSSRPSVQPEQDRKPMKSAPLGQHDSDSKSPRPIRLTGDLTHPSHDPVDFYQSGAEDIRQDNRPVKPSAALPNTRDLPQTHSSGSRLSPVLASADSWTDESHQHTAKQALDPDVEPEPSGFQQTSKSHKPEWNFLIPSISSTAVIVPGKAVQRLSAREIVSTLQRSSDERAIRNYFESYDKSTILSNINDEVDDIPTIFYAVATNNEYIVRIWIDHGADINAVHPSSGVPLLAFAIVNSEIIEEDTTDVVACLLSLGSSPLAIAEPFYRPYSHDLPADGPTDEELNLCGNLQTVWLHPETKRRLTRSLNLTHRYNLERALRTPRPSLRHRQVAERYKAEGLLGLPYFLIGQSLATNRLLQTCITHLANRSHRPKPLVVVFAGPSGHGKTELARRLGHLMSLELEVVDCTIVNREMELFGGRHPYVNAEAGTPLNNFLSRNTGQRCIVFMDEFEKTTREIHQALLLPFDSGEYVDRRNLKKVDCSKTIWILATNALDARIRNFCLVNQATLLNDEGQEEIQRLMKGLDKDLRSDFLARFDAPVTGRISAFLPFLLFSPSEQAVIAHKYLLELGRDVRKPVNLCSGPEERLVGNVRLHIRHDASVCAQLAEDGYHPDLGARSLITTVDTVRNMLVNGYLGVQEAIQEASEAVDFVIDIHKGSIIVEMDE